MDESRIAEIYNIGNGTVSVSAVPRSTEVRLLKCLAACRGMWEGGKAGPGGARR